MTQQEANKKLGELVQAAYTALQVAEAFAIEHELGFSFEPAYGMGGYFQGTDVGKDDGYGNESDGWSPSSMSC